jgi:putative ABC transport system permease protein
MIVALLAIVIGATILSGLLTIYYDIPRQMGQEFRAYGTNLIIVPGDNGRLSDEQMNEAVKFLPRENTVGVTPYRYETIKINEQPFMIAGTDLREAQKTSPYWFVAGEWPQASGEALIGREVAERINLAEGSGFTITGTDSRGESGSRDFIVTGIVQTGGTEEAFVFASREDVDEFMADTGVIDVVECSVSASAAELDGIAARIEGNVADAASLPVKRVTQSEGAVLTKLQSLIWLVTIIVLMLTMICVATTMMAVVTERRKEIGLKKALGASDKSITGEFLGEGLLLGVLGGVLGIALGFAFAQTISVHVFVRSISFQPFLIPVTLIVSVLITGLACLIPVRRAGRVDPAIVLRGE